MRWLGFGILLCLAGCYEVVANGAETVIQFGITARTVPIALVVVLTILGVKFWRRPRRVYGFLLLLSALTCVPLIWAVQAARIVLTDTEVYDYAGMPWAQSKRGFEYAQVAEVWTERVQRGSGRSSRSVFVWTLHLRDSRRRDGVRGPVAAAEAL